MLIGNRNRKGHFFSFVILVVHFLLLISCALTPEQKNFHVVREGDTLYAISWRYGYDFKDVARWNDLSPPYVINKGQLIRIRPPTPIESNGNSIQRSAPVVDNHRQNKQIAAKPVTKPKKPVLVKKPASKSKPVTKAKPQIPAKTKQATKFGWPLKGKVVSGFSGGNQGIDIAASAGQYVFASAGGKVVYSGEGLRQLGKLVIIKHDSRFLSAYGFNSRLLVEEGETVAAGQKIAQVGKNNQGQHVLHFEIRRDGNPINPIIYLK